MSADAVVFATNGSGGGDTKAAASTAMRDARKQLSNVEGTARTCTQVSVTCRGHSTTHFCPDPRGLRGTAACIITIEAKK